MGSRPAEGLRTLRANILVEPLNFDVPGAEARIDGRKDLAGSFSCWIRAGDSGDALGRLVQEEVAHRVFLATLTTSGSSPVTSQRICCIGLGPGGVPFGDSP